MSQKKHIDILALKNTISEMKILLERSNKSFELSEERINKCENRTMDDAVWVTDRKEKKKLKRLVDLWNIIKHTNMCKGKSQKEGRKRKGQKEYLKEK